MTNAEIVLTTEIMTVEAQAKVFGPAFSRLVGQIWVEWVAEKLNKEPPKVESFAKAVEYIRSNLKGCPNSYVGCPYAVGKAASMFEGRLGAMYSNAVRDATKKIFEEMGVTKVLTATPDITEALSKWIKFSEQAGYIPVGMWKAVGNGTSATLTANQCYYGEACNRLKKEGYTRLGGQIGCVGGNIHAIIAELMAKVQYDYKILKGEPPNCEVEVFRT